MERELQSGVGEGRMGRVCIRVGRRQAEKKEGAQETVVTVE